MSIPPRSKIGLGYLTVNLGNFVRGRKNTLPKVYAGIIDELDDSGVGPMLKSLARSKSHLILLNEASELLDSEVAYLVQEGWLVHQSNAKDLAIMIRCNYVGSYINQIAGSTMERPANKYLASALVKRRSKSRMDLETLRTTTTPT